LAMGNKKKSYKSKKNRRVRADAGRNEVPSRSIEVDRTNSEKSNHTIFQKKKKKPRMERWGALKGEADLLLF